MPINYQRRLLLEFLKAIDTTNSINAIGKRDEEDSSIGFCVSKEGKPIACPEEDMSILFPIPE